MKKIFNYILMLTMVIFVSSCSEERDGDEVVYYVDPVEENADTTPVEFPKTFVSQARFITIGTDMELYDMSDNYLGVVEERTLNLVRTFEYFDANDNLVAKAQKEFFSWGTKIDITDSNGDPIGYIEQQVFESMFSLYSKYKIYDADHKYVASSDKLDFFTSNLWIDGNSVSIKMHQQSFTLVDTWETTINGDIDNRLIVFIPAFVAASQAEKNNK